MRQPHHRSVAKLRIPGSRPRRCPGKERSPTRRWCEGPATVSSEGARDHRCYLHPGNADHGLSCPIGPFEGLTPTVTIASLVLVGGVALFGAVFGTVFERALADARVAVSPFLESFYIGLVSVVLVFVVWLGVGRYRNVRLGGDDEQPEFGTFSWISMLFAAGMGVGLIFWSVAEPVSHLQDNPFMPPDGGRTDADLAMRLSFFHWGLHGWGLFSLVAIVIGYFGFR